MRCPRCHRRLLPSARCPRDGELAPAPPGDFEDPACPAGFVLERRLGAGGSSQVWAAHDAAGRSVALKIALGAHGERFAREALALRTVGPSVGPGLFEDGARASIPFLSLEHLTGETLAERMAVTGGSGEMTVAEARACFGSLARTVAAANASGVVHRDLKPENIIWSAAGELRLLDFGLARITGVPGSDGQRMGTVHYMAPEQCLGTPDFGVSTDVYSLGVILFELLSGRTPFVGTAPAIHEAHAQRRPPALAAFVEGGAALDAVLSQALAKDPVRRYASALELLAAAERGFDVWQAGPSGRTGLAAEGSGKMAPLTDVPREPASRERPVALLGLKSARTLDILLPPVTAEGGALLRVTGGRYLFGFHEHLAVTAGLGAALRVTRAMGLLADEEQVVHVERLHVLQGRNGTRVAGKALESLASWWPVERAKDAPEVTRAAAEHLGPLAPRMEEAGPPTFVGRAALVASLVEQTVRACGTSRPALLVVEGELGFGKTRILDAVRSRLAEAHPALRVVSLRAEAPDAPETSGSLSLRWLRALDQSAPPGRERDFVARHEEARQLSGALRACAFERPTLVVVDDAHWADADALDALERATLEDAAAPLTVLLAARPDLLERRNHLGERAAFREVHRLPPLDDASARLLLRELLAPVEFLPDSVLARLCSLGHRVPSSLVELVRALRAAGSVRADPGSGAWYVAADELLDGSGAPLFEQLVAQRMRALPLNIRSVARLAALCGTEVTTAHFGAVFQHLDADFRSLDAGACLARLTRAGLMEQSTSGPYHFRHPHLRDALERGLTPELAAAFHRALAQTLEAKTSRTDAEEERLAGHHAARGEAARASTLYAQLGERARRSHRDAEGERLYSLALLELPAEEAPLREEVLFGRGRVRYRIQRYREALVDFQTARGLAKARGDTVREVELLLEEATGLDWLEDFGRSLVVTEEALLRAESVSSAAMTLWCALARGRVAVRRGDFPLARAALEEVARSVDAEGKSRLIARIMLGAVEAVLGDAAKSEATFKRAELQAEEEGDGVHLGALYSNRVLLWILQDLPERAIDDLQRARTLARELGHVQLERRSAHNLAELLHWMGRSEEALPLARRAQALTVRFFNERPGSTTALLLARVAVAAHEPAFAVQALDWMSAHPGPGPLNPVEEVQVALVNVLLARPSLGCEAVLSRARAELPRDEKLEVLTTLAAWRLGQGDTGAAEQLAGEAAGLAEGSLWVRRISQLRALLPQRLQAPAHG